MATWVQILLKSAKQRRSALIERFRQEWGAQEG